TVVWADFKRRTVVKAVQCRLPVRTGTDTLSNSAMDLIGRRLMWHESAVYGGRLTGVELRFGYESGDDRASRWIEVKDIRKPITITKKDIGLSNLMIPAR